jgi:hypothetical protein
MRIIAYRALHAEDVPPLLFAELDTLNDHFLAAFENYPDSEKIVVAAWATTGEITGEPIGAIVATLGHIITGYIDNLPSDDPVFDDEFGPPLAPDEPSETQVRAALLARLRQICKATWLLVHDADEIDGWTAQGFRVVAPPSDVSADEAVQVLAWGELPEDAEALLRARGLSWRRTAHRYGQG